MTYTGDPVRWDRTIYRGSVNTWKTRRVDSAGNPLVPASAQMQVRDKPGGTIWLDLSGTIDGQGWMTFTISDSATAAAAWDKRTRGVWDVEVIYSGEKLRWVMGDVKVSQDVTRS